MFLFIGGITIRFKEVRNVVFACPRCGVDRDGVLRSGRRWFTFFFIPLIPLKEIGHDVQCRTCHSSFDPRVLDAPTTAVISDQLVTAMRYAVAAMVRSGANSVARRDAAVRLMSETMAGYDEAQLDVDLTNTNEVQMEGWLRHFAGTLSPQGKEVFFSRIASIALAEGPFEDADRALLERIGQALLMTPAQVYGLLALIQQEPTL